MAGMAGRMSTVIKAKVSKLLDRAEGLGMTVARLPSLVEFKEAADDGKIELRPIALEDLLSRPQAALDRAVEAALRVAVQLRIAAQPVGRGRGALDHRPVDAAAVRARGRVRRAAGRRARRGGPRRLGRDRRCAR